MPAIVIGTSLASQAVDAASYAWGVWRTTTQDNGVERWNINQNMGATTATLFWDIAYSANGTVFSTGTINAGASAVSGDHTGFAVNAIAGWYYNFHWGATVTVKSFYIVRSAAEASVS